jgi:hypothetical protein
VKTAEEVVARTERELKMWEAETGRKT